MRPKITPNAVRSDDPAEIVAISTGKVTAERISAVGAARASGAPARTLASDVAAAVRASATVVVAAVRSAPLRTTAATTATTGGAGGGGKQPRISGLRIIAFTLAQFTTAEKVAGGGESSVCTMSSALHM